MASFETPGIARINGIALDALAALARRFVLDRPAVPVGCRVATRWKRGWRSESTTGLAGSAGGTVARQFTVVGDLPAAWLGGDSGPSPGELVLSALGSALVAAFILQATLQGVPIRTCAIELETEFDPRRCFGIDAATSVGAPRIDYVVHVEGGGTPRQYQDILAAARASCPVLASLAGPIDVRGELA